MDFFEEISNALSAETDDFSVDPLEDSLGISTAYTKSDMELPREYEIYGRFDSTRSVRTKRSISVDKDTTIHKNASMLFNNLVNSLNLESAVATSVSFSKVLLEENELIESWNFYTKKNADSSFLVKVDDENKREWESILKNEIIACVKKVDSDATEADIESFSLLFSDFDTHQIQQINVNINTPNPQRYFKDCESVNRYIEATSGSEKEAKRLQSQDKYSISFPLDAVEDLEGSSEYQSLVSTGEKIMIEHIDDTLHTDLEYLIEGEHISFGDFEYSRAGITYYVHIPVLNGTVGESCNR